MLLSSSSTLALLLRSGIVILSRTFWACTSILRSLLLNVLGAGGLWAVRGIAERHLHNHDDPEVMDKIFFPLYYCTLAGLFSWQILEWTIWTRKSYQEATENDLFDLSTVRAFPVHYLFDKVKLTTNNLMQCCFSKDNSDNIQTPQNRI